jgi:hypothetical protein
MYIDLKLIKAYLGTAAEINKFNSTAKFNPIKPKCEYLSYNPNDDKICYMNEIIKKFKHIGLGIDA